MKRNEEYVVWDAPQDEELFGNFGLEGKVIRITRKRGGNQYHEWGYTRDVPVRVLKEYPKYLLVEVLPHISESVGAFSQSHPYNITIHKHDLISGEVLVNGREARPLSSEQKEQLSILKELKLLMAN